MTIGVAFIRRVRNRHELVVASDSRLSGNGQSTDQARKIFGLPRSDALLSFAGHTEYAYPLMLQMVASIEVYTRSRDRRFPLSSAKGHAIKVFDQIYRSIHSLPIGAKYPEEPQVEFLFGGYSWQRREFRIWRFAFDRKARTFRAHRVGPFAFIGTREAVREARSRVAQALRDKNKSARELDMEPVEVVRDIIREGRYPSVGGAPQVAKVYEHLSTCFFSVKWPDQNGDYHVFGRPVLGYEQSDWPTFDPFTSRFADASTADVC